jgi:hypothetical protein
MRIPGKTAGWVSVLKIGWRGAAVGLVLALAAETAMVTMGKNFHTVLPGKAYRCAQLTGPALEETVHSYGIRTVVNLRGCSVPLDWYWEEARATHRLNVAQEDIAFSARRFPSVHEVRRLIRVFDEAAYPLLLHCKQGADRTGLAAAILLLLQPEIPPDIARRQLSLRYGHVAIDRVALLDTFLDLYAGWLEKCGLSHSPAVFRNWVATENFPGDCRCEIEPLAVPRRVAADRPFGMTVLVHNYGLFPWHFRAGNTAGHHLAYVLTNEQNRGIGSGRAGLLDTDVAPGSAIQLQVALPAFKKAGRYWVRLDMLDESNCWFYQAGSEPLEVELEAYE